MDGSSRISSPVWSLRTRRTVALIALFVAGVFAWRLSDMLPPVIISIVLAYLLSPVVGLLERIIPFGSENLRRLLGTLLTFTSAIMAVVLVILLLVPAIISQLRQFGEVLPDLFAQMEQDVEQVLSIPVTVGNYTFVPMEAITSIEAVNAAPFGIGEIDLVSATQDLLLPLTNPVLGALGTAVSGIVSTIFVLTMIFYLLKDGPRFVQAVENRVGEQYQGDVRFFVKELGKIWDAYLRGQLILALTMGVVVFLASIILGLRSPLVLGLLSGILEFIPNLGPALALLPAAAFAFFFPSTTIPGLEGVVFLLVVVGVWIGLQNLEAVFLVPRIMGNRLDLHPCVVIVAVIWGASLGGALGVILAAPVVASLRLLGRYLMYKLSAPYPSYLPETVQTPAMLADQEDYS